MTVLVTGANGFVGKALVGALLELGESVRAAYRNAPSINERYQSVTVGEITADTDWRDALRDVTTVVHTAARVHVMNERATDPLQAFRAINTEGTKNLALQASKRGVRRLIFLSSIKVNGEQTFDQAYTAEDRVAPTDAYAISKYEAEIELFELARELALEITVVRPPLIYGPGVKANFLRLIELIDKGYPLPFGAIHNNRRSLVGMTNLVDFLITCIKHPLAANQRFLVSDGEDISTTRLIMEIGYSLGRKPLLLPIPARLIEKLLSLLRREAVSQRLLGSLIVDIEKNRRLLGWAPKTTLKEELARTTDFYQVGSR